jgi:signal transduction histidine kinase/ActR/RegA family two-component response regulator
MWRAIDSPRSEACRQEGIGAGVAVPVLLESEPVAVLELFHREPRQRERTLLDLLDRVAVELARVAARERAEARRAEVQARVMAARKMEAIGHLAGGVAHDFNNLVNIVTLEAEDALGEAGLPQGVRTSLGAILEATERAGLLARRLLTFGRRKPGAPTAVELGEMLRGMRHLLGHLLGDAVTLRLHLEAPGTWVRADRAQIEHVLVNLILNARDAMPEGGEVAVGVRQLRIGEGPADRKEGLEAGTWAVLSVRDTGPGIPPGIRDRIFEPFFSTKRHGPGTGLGLSVCHGVVEEMGGVIRVESPPGRGATFEIVLPVDATLAAPEARPTSSPREAGEGESILLVQDEDDLRSVLARLLSTHGYRVDPVDRGEEAMEILEAGRSFDVIIADVGLPGIQGPELAQRARILAPDSAVMLTTGYSDLADAPGRADELGVDDIVQKPFTLDELLGRIRRVLDTKRGDPAAHVS